MFMCRYTKLLLCRVITDINLQPAKACNIWMIYFWIIINIIVANCFPIIRTFTGNTFYEHLAARSSTSYHRFLFLKLFQCWRNNPYNGIVVARITLHALCANRLENPPTITVFTVNLHIITFLTSLFISFSVSNSKRQKLANCCWLVLLCDCSQTH